MVFLGGARGPTTCDDINENESLNHATVDKIQEKHRNQATNVKKWWRNNGVFDWG